MIKGSRCSIALRRKLSDAHKGIGLGRVHSKATRRKISNSNKGRKFTATHKKKLSLSHIGILKGRKLTDTHKRNLSIANKGKLSWAKGKKFSKLHRKNMGSAQKGKIFSLSTRKKLSASVKKLYQNKEFLNRYALGQRTKPNRKEVQLRNILNYLFPKQYKYVGNFKVWMGGKNPDFINTNGQKKLIEFFGDYWHKNEKGTNRIKHFRKYGFDTLIIWEKELKNRIKLESKLVSFHMKGGIK